MGKRRKFIERLMSGSADTDISFEDLRHLLIRLNFEERTRGDHHIFTRDGIEEIVNLQPKGALAKSYQVKQVRNMIRKYHLSVEEEKEP